MVLLIDGILVGEHLPLYSAGRAVNAAVAVGDLSILLRGIWIVQELLGGAFLPLHAVKATNTVWDVNLHAVVQRGVFRAIDVHGGQTGKFRDLVGPFGGDKCKFVRGGVTCDLHRGLLVAGGGDVRRSVHSQTQVQLGPWEHPQDGDPGKIKVTPSHLLHWRMSIISEIQMKNTLSLTGTLMRRFFRFD